MTLTQRVADLEQRVSAQQKQIQELVEKQAAKPAGSPRPAAGFVDPTPSLPMIGKRLAKAQCPKHGMVSTNTLGKCPRCVHEALYAGKEPAQPAAYTAT